MKSSNVPEIRFKGFDGDWEQRKLGEVAELSSSKRIHVSDYVQTGIPFYRGSEVSTGGVSKDSELYISENLYNEIKEKYGVPTQGDLLITAVGTLGNIWKVDERKFYYKDGNLIRLGNLKLVADYLIAHFADGKGKKKVLDSAAGSNQKALTMVKLNEIDLFTPIKEEQTAIGSFFLTLDDTISLHKHKLDGLKELKKGYLQQMFPQAGDCVPRIRFAGFSEPWEQRKLGDVVERVQGNGGRMDLPTLTISAGSGWLDQRQRFSNNIAGKEQENYTLLSKGELSYNKGNSKLAKYGVVFELKTYKEALVPRVYHSFKPTYEANSTFLEYMFATKIPDNELAKLITSGARMDGLLNIGYDSFVGIKILIPAKEEQTAIGSFFLNLDEQITVQQAKLNKLKQLKAAYLQRMFI